MHFGSSDEVGYDKCTTLFRSWAVGQLFESRSLVSLDQVRLYLGRVIARRHWFRYGETFYNCVSHLDDLVTLKLSVIALSWLGSDLSKRVRLDEIRFGLSRNIKYKQKIEQGTIFI